MGDFLLKKIIQIHVNNKQRRERMKIRAQHQSRPSIPSHEKTAAHLDKLIKRKEMELPSKKRADKIIEAQEREGRELKAKELVMMLMSPLMAKEWSVVIGATKGVGLAMEILASQDADSVQCGSMQTLHPGQWLNNKVINYWEKLENIHASIRLNPMCHVFSGLISGVTPKL